MARLVICRAPSHHIPSVNRNTSTVFFGKVRPHICMVDSPSNVFSSRNPIVSSDVSCVRGQRWDTGPAATTRGYSSRGRTHTQAGGHNLVRVGCCVRVGSMCGLRYRWQPTDAAGASSGKRMRELPHNLPQKHRRSTKGDFVMIR